MFLTKCNPVVIHYHRLATKFSIFSFIWAYLSVHFQARKSLIPSTQCLLFTGPDLVISGTHVWFLFLGSHECIDCYFFLSFLVFFFVLASSPSSHILFSLLLNNFFLDCPSFCTFRHNKSPAPLKKFVQQYASIKQHPRIISPFMLGFML